MTEILSLFSLQAATLFNLKIQRHHFSKQRSIRFQSLINTFVTRHPRIFSKGTNVNPHSPGSKSLRAHAKPNSAFSFSLSSEIKTSPRRFFRVTVQRYSIVTRHLHWPAIYRKIGLEFFHECYPLLSPANDSYRLSYSLPKPLYDFSPRLERWQTRGQRPQARPQINSPAFPSFFSISQRFTRLFSGENQLESSWLDFFQVTGRRWNPRIYKRMVRWSWLAKVLYNFNLWIA